ncbi:MAG: group 1 truncated hemoglobin [Hyphomonadaceae bacterium]
MTESAQQKSHFERLGGMPALRAIVTRFYEKARTAPGLARFFAGREMQRLIDHQTHFVASLLGGPGAHTDAMIRDAHAGLGIGEPDFAMMLLMLREALEEAGLGASDVGLVVSEMRKRADLVIEH